MGIIEKIGECKKQANKLARVETRELTVALRGDNIFASYGVSAEITWFTRSPEPRQARERAIPHLSTKQDDLENRFQVQPRFFASIFS